jgi:hypothetical protein
MSLIKIIPGKPVPEFPRAEILEEKSEWWYFQDGENEDVDAFIDEKNLEEPPRANLSAYVADHLWFEENPHRRTRLRLQSQQEIRGLAAGELFQLNAVLCAVVRRYDDRPFMKERLLVWGPRVLLNEEVDIDLGEYRACELFEAARKRTEIARQRIR